MSFPVLNDSIKTLQNWSIKLNTRFKALQQQRAKYILNTEVDTGEDWVNGEPIYRKVIAFGSLPNAAGKAIAHNLQFSRIISLTGMTTNEAGIWLPLGWGSAVTARISNESIILQTSDNRTSYTDTYVDIRFLR